jgi:acetoin:2,6-dichlorophenolindophenol oxidoreductase subunit alpha
MLDGEGPILGSEMHARRLRRCHVDGETGRRLYASMLRIRHFELQAAQWWREGRISGEYHSSIGEEAVAAGVVDHLIDGDAIATDHRPTGPLVARGLPLSATFQELLGSPGGLCGGWGGHMHLLSPDLLAVSDGIVGASGPLACGFALSARQLRPGRVAVAFFGEGAVNQGMLLEAFNLASVWELPVLFVCKDSRWSITTRSRDMTGGDLDRRAASFGLATARADGADVGDVWSAAARLLDGARRGHPGFLRVEVRRPDGHLLGDALLRPLREPAAQSRELGTPLLRSLRRPGADRRAAARGLGELARRFALLVHDRARDHDPLPRARQLVGDEHARRIEAMVASEVSEAADAAAAAAEVAEVAEVGVR